MSAEGVTKIVNCLKPHVKAYFDQLIDDVSLETIQLHPECDYPAAVTDQECWPHFGIFYDYLIRREIYVLLEFEAVDKRAEKYKSEVEKYDTEMTEGNRIEKLEDGIRISINSENIDKLRKFLCSYEIFKKIENRTIDILEDIFNTSMLHMMSYGRYTVPYSPEFINESNIEDVLEYVRAWDRRRIKINPTVGGRFFIGDADLIFHDSIMDIKVSKYYPNHAWATFKRGIYQMIFYALGYFIIKGRERRTFKVYNPLLGVVHILDLRDLDFNELRRQVDNEPCWKDE